MRLVKLLTIAASIFLLLTTGAMAQTYFGFDETPRFNYFPPELPRAEVGEKAYAQAALVCHTKQDAQKALATFKEAKQNWYMFVGQMYDWPPMRTPSSPCKSMVAGFTPKEELPGKNINKGDHTLAVRLFRAETSPDKKGKRRSVYILILGMQRTA